MAAVVKETDKYFVLQEIRKKHEASGGHNGLPYNDLVKLVQIPELDLKETINELCREKKIKWNKGIHGIMFKMRSNG